MPRSSSKSVVHSPQAKRQTRGRNEKVSSPAKSPAGKTSALSPSPAKRSRRSATQQTTPPSTVKKAQSPSPKTKKSVASPKKSTERGRNLSRVKATVEEAISKKGKSVSRSPSKSKASASKGSPHPVVSKKARSPRKSPGQSSGSTKSPTKTPKSRAKSATPSKRSKSKSNSDTVAVKPKSVKSPAKSRSPAKSKTPKTPNSRGKKSSAKQIADEPVPVDSADLQETDSDKSAVDSGAVEVEKCVVTCTTSSDRKRKHEQVEDERINEVSQEPEAKIQKTSDQKDEETHSENVSDHKVAAESVNALVSKEIKNAHNDLPVTAVTGDSIVGAAKTDYENDYEIISKEDVPAADSDEVIKAAEKMVPLPEPEVISDSQENSPATANGDEHNDCEADVLLSREFLTNPAIDASIASANRVFSIVSYNILADVHAQKDFSGDRAPWISDSQLAVSYRHQRLMKELQYLDADIVCLQEVGGDYLAELLIPSMEALGYKGLFIPRNTTNYCEGEATFYRTSKFSIIDSREMKLSEVINEEVDASSLEIELKDGVKEALQTHGVAVIVKLKSQVSGDEIAVANIHVTYDNLVRPDRRCIQLAMTIRKLVEIANGGVKPYIICGDFNSWPDSAPYQFVKNGLLTDETFEELQAIDDAVALQEGQTAPVVNIWTDGFSFPVVGDLKSSYAVVTGSEPLTSRFAFDGGLRAVDYIWYSSANLQPLGVLKVVKPHLIEPGVPNAVFPSDHMSLKAKFAFA